VRCIRNDRSYNGKYDDPSEYVASESACRRC
jgi:hypothetical protein